MGELKERMYETCAIGSSDLSTTWIFGPIRVHGEIGDFFANHIQEDLFCENHEYWVKLILRALEIV